MWQGLNTVVAVPLLAKPALLEAVHGAPEAFATVEKPHVAPEIDQPIWRGLAGQVDPTRRARGDPRQALRSLRALPEPERLEPDGFVGHHGTKRPEFMNQIDQPRHVFVIDAVHVGLLAQRSDAFVGGPERSSNTDARQVRPLADFFGPDVPAHSPWCQDEYRERRSAAAVSRFERGQDRDRLTESHRREQPGARIVQ